MMTFDAIPHFKIPKKQKTVSSKHTVSKRSEAQCIYLYYSNLIYSNLIYSALPFCVQVVSNLYTICIHRVHILNTNCIQSVSKIGMIPIFAKGSQSGNKNVDKNCDMREYAISEVNPMDFDINTISGVGTIVGSVIIGFLIGGAVVLLLG